MTTEECQRTILMKLAEKNVGESLADPAQYENLFPGFAEALIIEESNRNRATKRRQSQTAQPEPSFIPVATENGGNQDRSEPVTEKRELISCSSSSPSEEVDDDDDDADVYASPAEDDDDDGPSTESSKRRD
uniref:Uncharacterized protein n=1 Tax=Ditylenchus dipsaci TaxID=166011 RepID=A0A915E4B1_9BILA